MLASCQDELKQTGIMDALEDGIAVIGVGCNFPGGEGIDNFWSVLLEGKNCTSDIPPTRFSSALWHDPDDEKPGKTHTRRAAFISGFNEFDHKFFGISEAEADFMDPQQKLLLHCTYRALEDAGVSLESISGSRTGVIIGLMNRDYETLKSDNPSSINHYNATGTAMSIAANRISFTFNLTGPSFAIDSACSSSLVALHLACQSLKQGECEMAVCGGVSCIIEPRVFVALSKAKMISGDGISQPFSKSADGYGRGEGCGVVLLKPLKNAIKDHNKIWGIVSKTAVNQDGRRVIPITRPSSFQQEELLRQIYSGTDLAHVQYIEAHGTGTAVGDHTESTSIANVIAAAKPAADTLKIGSVKGNIGHTESAAGVAGLIKVLLMMRHETFVPTLFYSDDSASINAKNLKLDIPTKAERWDTNGRSERVAGINSFGFGGTNAHAVVKEYKQQASPTQMPKSYSKVFIISGSTEKMIQTSIRDLQTKLNNDTSIDAQALSFTLACGRSHFRHKYRKVFLAASIRELEKQLVPAIDMKVEPTRPNIQVVFVFCGNGVAHRGMCRQLLRDEPVFREKIVEVEKAFSKYQHMGITEKLAGDVGEEDFRIPNVVQPLLFAVQFGVAALLKQWGVKPDVVLGHSVGEVAAACSSGLLSLEDAVKVIYHRSALQAKVMSGKMLVVGNVVVEETLKVIAEFRDCVCVAAYNSPLSCTLSGEADAIDNLHEKLSIMFADKNAFLYVLDVPAAYHSPIMDPILDEIENNIQSLNANSTECQLFSTVTGKRNAVGDFSTGKYWTKNVRQPVLFKQTLQAVIRDQDASKNLVFVEISPRKALQRNIQETLQNHVVLSCVEAVKDCHAILSTVAKLFEVGVNVDWRKVYKGYETIPIALPVYQFETKKNNVCFENLRKGGQVTSASHPLLGQNAERNTSVFNVTQEAAPYVWEHKNNGVQIVPGALYVELGFESVISSLKPKRPVSSLKLSVRFHSLCTLSSDVLQLKVSLDQKGKQSEFTVDSSVSTHASGTYLWSDGDPLTEEPCICLDTISQRCTSVVESSQVYALLDEAGFEYGPVFRQLSNVPFGEEYKEAMAPVEVPEEVLKDFHEYIIHPVLLDTFLQMTSVVAMQESVAKPGFPSAIGSIVIAGRLQKQMIMYLRATQDTPDFFEVCGCFADTDGNVLVELTGVRISFINHCQEIQQLFYHNEILTVASDQSPLSKIKGIVFEDSRDFAKALRPYLDSESISVIQGPQWTRSRMKEIVLSSQCLLNDVIFVWNLEDLSYMTSEKTLRALVDSCMQFQQMLLALKDSECSYNVRVVTYRSTEEAVSYICPAFVAHGLIRACAAEMTEVTFQLIDLASVTSEDIEALVCVINTCMEQEIMIEKGQIKTTRIVPTPEQKNGDYSNRLHSGHINNFSVRTINPYKMTHLSVSPTETSENLDIDLGFLEVELKNVCVHSADYFPVSTSLLQFGETFYWNKHATQSHSVLALDFSGIVTTVGKNVRNVKVGDHIASCYPVAASSRVRVPEAACFNTKDFPYFKETPCVSYFIIAGEILQRCLTNVKRHQRKLALISSSPASNMMKVLALTANRSGWNVSSLSLFSEEHLDRWHAVVFLAPFENTSITSLDQPLKETHFVFVSSMTSSPQSLRRFAAKHDNTHVHHVNVLDVLQKAKLQTHNTMISNWLMSLGFAAESLPLKRETNPLERLDEPTESYFTTKTVKQVSLDKGLCGCTVLTTPVQPKQRRVFKQQSVYIVTGGLSGLGWETVKFIAQNGGQCIATLSRKELSDKMQIAVDDLQRRYCVEVYTVQCDVAVSVQVDKAISKIQKRFPACPVKGVFHSAAVLHDGLIETLDESLFQKVLRPKVCGALNLHYATLHSKLDYFVCYSSVSSFIGNSSQSNYAAANSFLDTFCHYRRNLGLAGQSINWGPLNLGLLKKKALFQNFLQTKGLMAIEVYDVHLALKTCLSLNRVQQMICKFNIKTLHYHTLSQNLFLRKRLSTLVQSELKEQLASENTVMDAPLSTQERVRRIVSDLTNVSVSEFNDHTALCGLGIDSMLAMTLQSKVFQETGVSVPLIKILDPKCTLATLISAVGKC